MYAVKTLNAISPVYESVLDMSGYAFDAYAENPDAIIVRSANMHEMDIPESVHCVARAGAGVNNIPVDRLAERGVVVFNSPGANANAVKEMALTGMLLASRRVVEAVEWCRTLSGKGDEVDKLVEKGKGQFVGPELMGKTLGVIGLGEIGVLVANTGVALGMKVLGYDPYISVDHAWRLSRSVSHSLDIDEVLKNSDYISLHVPLMDMTRNMIDAAALSKMKPTAALLNFSRGGLVSTQAVKGALSTGLLRAYVTDFPSDELIGATGVICIPHLGASTPESEDNCVRMVAKQMDEYLRYGSIVNSVNYPDCPLSRPAGPRLTLLHKNVPNVIGSVTHLISDEGLNIDNMINRSRGAYAYTVLEFDSTPSDAIVEKMRSLDTTYRVRLILP